jgi:hypothetical protein
MHSLKTSKQNVLRNSFDSVSLLLCIQVNHYGDNVFQSARKAVFQIIN